MSTVLRASPKGFVSTPAVERIAVRGMRYLQSGFSVHLRGPAGTGKTTLALHLADLLGRPIMLIFGDDELKSSDMIGNQLGYTHKKVVDNYIHSVVKVEDEMRQNWIDSRLTLACREGFTLVYDEFNRSRPEVNNVLLSALEEKLLVLPPNANRSEYIRVHPQFRAIFTSNPEEYCGVHGTQDALMDRLVTISMPEPDEITQTQILVQKIGVEREEAARIVQFVKAFREGADTEKSSGLRACLRIAKVCREHEIPTSPENADFRDICTDVLLSRTKLEVEKATKLLWEIFDKFSTKGEGSVLENFGGYSVGENLAIADELLNSQPNPPLNSAIQQTTAIKIPPILELEPSDTQPNSPSEEEAIAQSQEIQEALIPPPEEVAYEAEIYAYLLESQGAKVSEIEAALQISRVQTIDALRSLIKKGVIKQHENRLFADRGDN